MKQGKAIFFAVLAAALYAINSPLSKLLLERLTPTMLAALLYLGAGIGLSIVGIVQRKTAKVTKEAPLTKKRVAIYFRNGSSGYCSTYISDDRSDYDNRC